MASINEILLRVLGDTDDAERDLRRLSGELETFDRQEADAEVTIDDSPFERKRKQLLARLRQLDAETADIEVEAETATTMFQLRLVEQQLKSLERQAIRTSLVMRMRRGLSGLAEGLGNVRRQLTPSAVSLGRFTFNLGRLGPLATVVASTLSKSLYAAIISVASSAAMAASGILSMVSAMGSAAVEAGKLAGAYTVAFLGTLVPTVLLGIGVMDRFERTVEEAGSAANRLQKQVDGVTKRFRRALAPAADLVLGALADGLSRLAPIVDTLREDFTRFGRAVASAIRSAAEELTSPAWRRGFSVLTNGARRIIPTLLDGLMGLAATLRNISVATMPLLINAFDRLAGKTREWQRETSDASGIRQALQRARREVGVFGDLLGEVGRLWGNVFGAGVDVGRRLTRQLTRAIETANEWLETATGQREINEFWESAAGHLRTWARAGAQVVDMIAALVSVAAPFGRRIVRDIGDAAERFAEWVRSAEGSERIRRIFEELLPLLGSTLRLAGNLGRVMLVAAQLASAALKPFIDVLADLLGVVADAAEWIDRHLSGALRTLVGVALFVVGPIKLVRGAIAAVRGIVFLASKAFGQMRGAVLAVGAVFGALPGVVSDAAGDVLGTAKGLVEDVVDVVEDFASDALDAGKELFESVAEGIGDAARAVIGVGAKIVSAVIGRITGAFGRAVSAGRGLFNRVRSGIASVAGSVIGAAGSIVSSAVGRVGAAFGRALSAGQTLFTKVKNGILRVGGDVASTAGDVVSGAVEKVGDAFSRALSAGETLFTKVKNGISRTAGDVAGAAGDVVSGAVSRVGNFASSFYSAGQSLIQNFINGIGSLAGAVKDKVSSVISAAKDLLPGSEPKDPSSPLRNLGDSGRALVENLVAGISAAGPRLSDTLSRNLEAAVHVPQLAAPRPAGGGQTSNTYNLQVSTPSGGPPDPEMALALLDSKLRARGGVG